jgi:hypothetical protein
MQTIIGKRGALLAALAAIAGGLLAVGVAAHSDRYPTEMSATIQTANTITDHIRGRLLSSRTACAPDRKVRVFRKRPGDDQQIASDFSGTFTETIGSPYTVAVPGGDFSPGVYYAHAKRRDLRPGARHDHVCKGKRSQDFSVTP